MSGDGKTWNDRWFFCWIYRVLDTAARANWLHSLIHFRYSDWLSRYQNLKLERLKICEAFCVTGHYGANISNIKISWCFCLLLFLECFGEIWRKSIKSIYPINSLKADVFVPKSNARFQLVSKGSQTIRATPGDYLASNGMMGPPGVTDARSRFRGKSKPWQKLFFFFLSRSLGGAFRRTTQ